MTPPPQIRFGSSVRAFATISETSEIAFNLFGLRFSCSFKQLFLAFQAAHILCKRRSLRNTIGLLRVTSKRTAACTCARDSRPLRCRSLINRPVYEPLGR